LYAPAVLSRFALAHFALIAVVALAWPSGNAQAESLTASESARLERGETVIRSHTIDRGEAHYVGGVTYTVLSATAAEISALFDDVSTYRHVLPKTKGARRVGVDQGDTLIELVQGNAVYEATYTIRVRRSSRELRFWLEPTRPHEIDDAWGFFRIDPFIGPSGEERVLLTYGVLVDVGPGIVRELFEERVRAAMLSVPQLVQRHLARRG
jgi:hypothetical protein